MQLPTLPLALPALSPNIEDCEIRLREPRLCPDTACKKKLKGIVRVQVVVSPYGSVKETKVIGGHPILVTAAVDAVKKWKFDPASAETTGILEIKF